LTNVTVDLTVVLISPVDMLIVAISAMSSIKDTTVDLTMARLDSPPLKKVGLSDECRAI